RCGTRSLSRVDRLFMDFRGIVYERHGSGAPLVLLHGLGHRRQAWDPVLRPLSERPEGYTLHPPGFGQSPATDPERPFGIGGAVALELGARGLASSVTALSPIGFTRGAEMLGSRILVGGMHVATRVPARVWHSVIDSRPVRALTTLALHGSVRDPRGDMARLDPAVVTRGSAYTRLAPEVVRYSFDGGPVVQCPTTVAWGEDDRVLPVRAVRRVIDAIPHAWQVRLLGCGHIPMDD